MTKIVVPDGMLKAAEEEARENNVSGIVAIQGVIEAAIRWLAENPIVPTKEQCDAIYNDSPYNDMEDYLNRLSSQWTWAEWQRRMFLAPEPEVPEAVKGLLWGSGDDHSFINVERCKVDADILEAYRRGRNAR